MDDIDSLFGRLRQLPVDPRLSSIDGAVFHGIAQPSILRPTSLAQIV